MKRSYSHYPIDIILCLLWSLVLVPVVMFSMDTTIRTIIGLPFLLFLPGYVLVFVLFPSKKTDRGIDTIERVALSFGLSIAIVPLLGLLLNYTPWGIRLEPILLSVFCFILVMGLVGIIRWYRTAGEERFTISLALPRFQKTSKLDSILTIILIVCIIIAVVALVYVLLTPKIGERFTEFYLLGPSGKATGYPRDLLVGENATVILGLANHEYRSMNYTMEVWLINQTILFNESSKQNETVYHHMWFVDSLSVMANHTAVDTEHPWTAQWEYNYTVAIQKTGELKLAFLLYTSPQDSYFVDTDYASRADEKLADAYRELHLWLFVQ